MKRIKKLASLVMAMVMALTLAVPAMAADKYTITIENADTGHTYEAYQIFKGELHGAILSNIEWGSGITEAGQNALEEKANVDNAAAVANQLEAEKDAKLFAEEVGKYLAAPAGTSVAATGGYTISGLEAGYYLIKDKDGSLSGVDDVYTEYIVEIVADTKVFPKDSVATFEKKVEDRNDTMDRRSEWQDSADHDIGDEVPFRLVANLPANLSSFDTYKLEIYDTLSKGLTYTPGSLSVVVAGKEQAIQPVVVNNADGTTNLTFTFDDVIALGAKNSDRVVVSYTARLNSDAVIGSLGNPNTAYMKYSNNPNGDGMGKTVDDTVIVFTYKVVVNKVDEKGNALDGATFKLEKILSDGHRVEIAVVEAESGAQFTFAGLDDGDYILTETATPAGYNDIDPIKFTVSASHDILSDEPQLTSLTGNVTTGDIEFTPVVSDGSLTSTVMNQAGATLPETGGMGTTLFYVLGGILVIGAGVAMVTKKRMA